MLPNDNYLSSSTLMWSPTRLYTWPNFIQFLSATIWTYYSLLQQAFYSNDTSYLVMKIETVWNLCLAAIKDWMVSNFLQLSTNQTCLN